eukprot:6213100-Pleurochrysis_carterae.AAC.4
MRFTVPCTKLRIKHAEGALSDQACESGNDDFDCGACGGTVTRAVTARENESERRCVEGCADIASFGKTPSACLRARKDALVSRWRAHESSSPTSGKPACST